MKYNYFRCDSQQFSGHRKKSYLICDITRKLIKKYYITLYICVSTHFGKTLFGTFFKKSLQRRFSKDTLFFRVITLFILFFSYLNNIFRISYVHYTNRSTIFFFNSWVQNRHLMSGKYFCSYFQYNVRLNYSNSETNSINTHFTKTS